MISHRSSYILGNVADNAVFFGVAAYFIGQVSVESAAIIGGTYALVAEVTKPYFGDRGLLAIVGAVVNVTITTALLNLFFQKKVTILGTVLPALAMPFIVMIQIEISAAILVFGCAYISSLFRA